MNEPDTLEMTPTETGGEGVNLRHMTATEAALYAENLGEGGGETDSGSQPDATVSAPSSEVPNPEKKRLLVPDYNPVETLLTKLEHWLLVQPEWAVILAAPRATRRKAITLMSKRLLTIPNRYRQEV